MRHGLKFLMLFSATQTLNFIYSHRWSLRQAMKGLFWCHGSVVCHRLRFDPDGYIHNRSSAARQFCDKPQVCSPRLRLSKSCIHDDEHQPVDFAIVVTGLHTDRCRSALNHTLENMSETSQIWGDLPPWATPNSIFTYRDGDRLRQETEKG